MNADDRAAIRARLNATIGMMPRTDAEALLDLADDLEQEVQRLRQRPTRAEVVSAAMAACESGDVIWVKDAEDIADAILPLFPTVEGGDTRG